MKRKRTRDAWLAERRLDRDWVRRNAEAYDYIIRRIRQKRQQSTGELDGTRTKGKENDGIPF